MFALVYIIFSFKTCYVNHFLAFPEFRPVRRFAKGSETSDLQEPQVPGTFFLKSRTEKRRFIFPKTLNHYTAGGAFTGAPRIVRNQSLKEPRLADLFLAKSRTEKRSRISLNPHFPAITFHARELRFWPIYPRAKELGDKMFIFLKNLD